MAARADTPVIDTPQDPDIAIKLYHFWDVAHRIRREPVVLYPSVKATTEQGKALQLQAWAIYHGATFPDAAKVLESRRDLIGPHSFEKLLSDFIAADQAYIAADPDDEDRRDTTHSHRSNALFSLFAAGPETIGQAREILRAAVHEFADCELTVGGPLPDSIELALRNILMLLDRLNPAAGGQVQS